MREKLQHPGRDNEGQVRVGAVEAELHEGEKNTGRNTRNTKFQNH